MEWPKELEYVPLYLRFVDAETGRPVPLIGLHYPTEDGSMCAMCRRMKEEIERDPTMPCDIPIPCEKDT